MKFFRFHLLICAFMVILWAEQESSEQLLQRRYDFKDNVITSQDILKDAPLFPLFKVANSVNLYRAKSSDIVDKFKEHGIIVKSRSNIIEFLRVQKERVPFLEEKIAPFYLEKFKKNHILIQDVIVTPVSSVELEDFVFQEYQFPEKLHSRSSGTFPAIFLTKEGERRKIYFRFQIEATIEALVSAVKLKSGDVVGLREVEISRIPFERVTREWMERKDVGLYSIRSYTNKGSLLLKSDLVPKVVIRRGDPVFVQVSEGGVMLSFDGIAQQDGAVGKSIRIKNPRTNKSYDVRVISEGKVEIK
ncbi:flagellar basal body P-ring formation chaperone FlgA [Helicobacter monodelphidis]|uniref:flagellar basal body P-ring formation chaperone FlgA n=1 Tax=Helicobacter sp. 15-1451 TaxID=2004995 RepID=UPI0015EBEABB|nr:flagellar basal body P-ring formation chaperone FlgA [Helicobacter sp. 15-1451]